MCICLAYVRALVGLVLGQVPDGEPGSFDYSQRTSIHTAQERMKNVSHHLAFTTHCGVVYSPALSIGIKIERRCVSIALGEEEGVGIWT